MHWADSEDEVRLAQRLRYRVFTEEIGAVLAPPAGTPPGIDADRFDPFCDHLLVRARSAPEDTQGIVVGTYRVLPPTAARRAGGLYADTEFDLAPLRSLRAHAVELGRSCVHPAWRSGGVILALWSALAQYMQLHDLDTMIGCASVGIADGGTAARLIWQRLREAHLAPPCWQVKPLIPLRLDPIEGSDNDGAGAAAWGLLLPTALLPTPPLIKGYLRCGARLLGPPALDVAFNTADLPMMMRIADLAPRYRKHFLGA